jgi:hypothetical protein
MIEISSQPITTLSDKFGMPSFGARNVLARNLNVACFLSSVYCQLLKPASNKALTALIFLKIL